MGMGRPEMDGRKVLLDLIDSNGTIEGTRGGTGKYAGISVCLLLLGGSRQFLLVFMGWYRFFLCLNHPRTGT